MKKTFCWKLLIRSSLTCKLNSHFESAQCFFLPYFAYCVSLSPTHRHQNDPNTRATLTVSSYVNQIASISTPEARVFCGKFFVFLDAKVVKKWLLKHIFSILPFNPCQRKCFMIDKDCEVGHALVRESTTSRQILLLFGQIRFSLFFSFPSESGGAMFCVRQKPLQILHI